MQSGFLFLQIFFFYYFYNSTTLEDCRSVVPDGVSMTSVGSIPAHKSELILGEFSFTINHATFEKLDGTQEENRRGLCKKSVNLYFSLLY